jgi:hypothetical protein
MKSCLVLIEDPNQWNDLVYGLNNMRSRVEHNDYRYPSKTALSGLRSQAEEFKDWILKVGRLYHSKSERFSFAQKYSALSRWYIGEADWMLHLYGERIPYVAQRGYVPSGEEHPYEKLKSARDVLESRIREIGGIDDIKHDDLDNLVDLVREVERLKAKEEILLQQSVCPKCGGKIVQTERAVGGSPDDPMPYAVLYRVGCNKCDYELDRETIEL